MSVQAELKDMGLPSEAIPADLEVQKIRVRPSEVLGKIGTYVALVAYGIFSLLPLYWIGTLAFKVNTEIYTRTPKLWGFVTTLDHWREVFAGKASTTGVDFLQAITNSLVTVPLAVLLALLLGAPVAYILARSNFKGKEDIHERNLNYRKKVEKVYLDLAKRYRHWIKVDCVKDGKILPPDVIHNEIVKILRQKKYI